MSDCVMCGGDLKMIGKGLRAQGEGLKMLGEGLMAGSGLKKEIKKAKSLLVKRQERKT